MRHIRDIIRMAAIPRYIYEAGSLTCEQLEALAFSQPGDVTPVHSLDCIRPLQTNPVHIHIHTGRRIIRRTASMGPQIRRNYRA